MDSRDVTTPVDRESNFLEGIYDLQKVLVDHYIGIEGLPQYPINVNTKANQTLLKDFTSRVIEELAEGFEALNFVAQSTFEHKFWTEGQFEKTAYQAMLNHLQNVGEEMADAMHFYIELLIYANIQPEDIVSWLTKRFNIPSHTVEDNEALKLIMYYGKFLILENVHSASQIQELVKIDLLKHSEDKSKDFVSYHKCSQFFNHEFMDTYKQIMWDITYFLNISRNFLKNKPWKQSEVMTQETAYQEHLVIGFCILMGLLELFGCEDKDVYFLYFKKNQINQFRIKSNY